MASRPELVTAVLQGLGDLSTWMHETKRWKIAGDMTLHQATALYHIVEAKELEPNKLAALLNAAPPSITALVGRLERQQLITRHVHDDDRRRVTLRPTELGLQRGAMTLAAINRHAAATFAGWTDEELERFQQAMARLVTIPKPEEVGL